MTKSPERSSTDIPHRHVSSWPSCCCVQATFDEPAKSGSRGCPPNCLTNARVCNLCPCQHTLQHTLHAT
jgi:hypothetical protein